MSAMPVQAHPRPYVVSYYKDGKKVNIRRTPPPAMHEMLPTDVVKLNFTKNADFREGENFTVKNINPRHPNTLQITNEEGAHTFVPYYDLELKERVAHRGEGKDPRYNRYLTWP